jgi:RNA polymerase sigma-70 factor, ECF subfamily
MIQVDETATGADRAIPSFEAWYEATYERVARTLAATTEPEIAAEATAEAFVRAYERWARVGSMRNPDGWVYQVARNVARRRHQRRLLETRLLPWVAREPATTGGTADPDLWDAVRSLTPRQREAIALRYLGGYSEAEVADAMGVRVGTASATLATARKRLEALLVEVDR